MNIFLNLSIRRKLFLLFCVITIPFLVLTLYSTFKSREEAMENARERTLQLVETVVAEQRIVEASTRQLLSALAKLPEFQKRNVERCTEILHELAKQNPMYANLLFADSQGNAIASARPFKPFSIKHRKYFQEAKKTMDFSVGEYAVAIVASKPVLHYAYPVKDKKNVLKGILVAAFDLDHYEELFKKAGMPQGSSFTIVDHKGVRLFRFPIIKEAVGQNDLRMMMAFMSGPDEKGTFLTTGVDGVNRLYAFSKIRLRAQDPPYVFVRDGIPETVVLAGANEMMKRNIFIIGLTILVSILLAWHLGKNLFVRRLEQLSVFAERVQKGDTEARTNVPHTRDELGMLAESFDNMANGMEERDRDKEQAHKLLDEIIEFLPDATFVIDADGKVITWNRAIERMTGVPKEEMIGKGDYEYAIPFYGERRPIFIDLALLPDAEFEKEKYNTVHRGAEAEVYVPKIYGGKGAYLSVKASRLHDASGNITGAIESICDIAARKQAEKALRESEELYRSLFGNMLNGLAHCRMLFDQEEKPQDFIYLNVNSAFESLTGLKNVVGRKVSEVIPGIRESDAGLFEIYGRVALNGKPEKFERYVESLKMWFSISVYSPQKEYIVVIFDVITERKKSEEELRRTLDRLRHAIGTTFQVMVSAVEARDPYTADHQTRSSNLARAIAAEMGLPRDKIDAIRMSGSIHDIGKLSIPAEILSKSTKLSEIEFKLIKEHARQGYEILKNVESSWPLAEMVYQHHERMDGSGYPRHLKGEGILMEARILAVADVVEAIASHRPYRPALGIETALTEIEKNSGTLYDRAVADACLRLFRDKGFQLART